MTCSERRNTVEFARALDASSRRASERSPHGVLLELPLLPGRWSYGATQRRLAKKHAASCPEACARARHRARGQHIRRIISRKGHDALART